MYTTEQIRDILGALLLATVGGNDHIITDLSFDSRQLPRPRQTLFIALPGMRTDGHNFISTAYRLGVRAFLVGRTTPSPGPGAVVFQVKDPLTALHRLARYHRRCFAYPVLAITGSNGKTIVKEWLAELLQPEMPIVRSPRSYNSQIGVPLSLWRMQSEHGYGIFEAGISQEGEMAILADLIHPTIGIFTVLGSAHDAGFTSRQQKLEEKFRLFEKCEWIVHAANDPMVNQAVARLSAKPFSWSFSDQQATVYVAEKSHSSEGTRLKILFRESEYTLLLPFTDEPSIHNALTCWSTLALLDHINPTITQRFESLNHLPLRLDMREGINQCRLINDSYNNDLTGLEMALDFMQQQATGQTRTLILSDLEQSGLTTEELLAKLGALLRQYHTQRFIGVGADMQRLVSILPASIIASGFDHTQSLLDALPNLSFSDEIILIKGARSFAFERISDRLSQKVHQTRLYINLSALSHNLSVIHQKLRSETKTMVMVKAAAYGTGSAPVAQWLEREGVDYLGVAYADEGVALRQAGVQLPILVLNPEEAVFDTLVRYQLEPEIYSLEQARALHRYLDFSESPMNVHFNIDTGMHRLGFMEADWPGLLKALSSWQRFSIQSVFTHLAASDAPEHDEYTHRQVSRFNRVFRSIVDLLGYRPLAHVLNSSGITRFPQYQMDMVRLGIGMYGCGKATLGLKKVLEFKATVSQIKYISPGQSVGYGRLGQADTPRRIATITAGYADGLPRAAGNGVFSVGRGAHRYPIVGQVCMDMCMIDTTHDPDLKIGDSVVIFGESPTVEEMAQSLRTIPYELFTGISPRVQRIYLRE